MSVSYENVSPNIDTESNLRRLARTSFVMVVVVAASLLGLSSPTSAATKEVTSGSVTTVTDAGGWSATFTRGARTVTVRGPQRTLGEPGVSPTVTSNIWVRILPKAFAGSVNYSWLKKAQADRSPDVLATALQYVAQAPAIRDSTGLQIAGDAQYGPLQVDGTRAEGSDFNDYLGVSWTYPTGTDKPEPDQFRSLDCSGFVRMIFGYRLQMPLNIVPDAGVSIPRRAFEVAAQAPGKVMVANSGTQAAVTNNIRPGDLVFFDAATDDGTQIDHVGIYLGLDNSGDARFISSRKTPNGPTLGDQGAVSTISGTGFYARAFRMDRRL